jgi:hypothetical protein
MRRDAADGCRLHLEAVRDACAGQRKRDKAASRSIRRATDNLPQRAATVVYLADLEFVGAGVRCGLHNAGDNNQLKPLIEALDALYFDACSRQRPRDLSGRQTGQIHPLS